MQLTAFRIFKYRNIEDATLEKENLSFWQDLVVLKGGQDWWSQIENALRSKDLEHFILVITPAAELVVDVLIPFFLWKSPFFQRPSE
jgi:hypothetical protein